jgi:lysophospholipase L1-like esterase
VRWAYLFGAIVIVGVFLVGSILLRNEPIEQAEQLEQQEQPEQAEHPQEVEQPEQPEQPEQIKRRMLPQDHSQPIIYVALGDSTVAGIGASSSKQNYVSRLSDRLRSIYPNAEMTNLGVGGATAADVVAGQLEPAVALDPDLVTLSIGPNDITQGRSPDQYERDMETIFRTFAEETNAVVVVNLIPDLAAAPRFEREVREALGRQTSLFNYALARQAQRYDVEIVDLYTTSQEEVSLHPQLLAADDYHPSDEGYARWAELMWSGVEARIE